MAPEVGYWGIRGIVNPIRLLLEYTGEKYEFKDWNTAQPGWFDQKHQLGMFFPNLPYVIDGNTKLTQSGAIIRYFARKHNLVATSEEELQQQDMADGYLNDIRFGWSVLCYVLDDFETSQKKYRAERLEPVLKEIEKLLAGQEYLVKNKLTYTDFVCFEILDINEMMFPGLLKGFPHLEKYHAKIGGLKGVKEFLASDRNPKGINGPSAKWGGGEPR